MNDRPNTRNGQAMQIVIAWTEQSAEFVEQVYIGGGEHKNVFRDVVIGKACMWLNNGARSDIANAQKYASKEIPSAHVLTFQGEQDPLGKAKREILRIAANENQASTLTPEQKEN